MMLSNNWDFKGLKFQEILQHVMPKEEYQLIGIYKLADPCLLIYRSKQK